MIQARRKILVMTLVATALCTPRVDASQSDQARLLNATATFARLATRLSGTFRHVVPAVRLHRDFHSNRSDLAVLHLTAQLAFFHATHGDVFEYRLPPPDVTSIWLV